MSTIITKSLASDFGGSLTIEQLHHEIEDDTTIAQNIAGVTINGDVVDIEFDTALSGAESTQLDSLVGTHTPAAPAPVYTKIHTAYTRKDQYKDSGYRDISAYAYPGQRQIGPIQQIVCVAFKDASTTNYSIRVYDHTHNRVIAENTFTNNEKDSVELTPLSNIPKNKAMLTVQVKKSGGGNSYMHIENIQFRI
jgi:hypothetical protein